MTIDELKATNPFPWRYETNFDGRGGVRVLDANNKPVDLFNIVGLAVYASRKMLDGTINSNGEVK